MKYVNQRKTIIIWLHSCVEYKKQHRDGKGREGKLNGKLSGRQTMTHRLLTTGNKLKTAGGEVGGGWDNWVMGIKEAM